MRNLLLNTIISDISRITTANGYNHDAPAASKYYSTIDDASITPRVVIQCASQFSTPTEAGLDTTVKININTHISVNSDVDKSGKLSNESEKWIEDFTKFFTHPSCSGADTAKISTLWNLNGIEYYYISAIEPYNERNDNRHTVFIELTISLIIPA